MIDSNQLAHDARGDEIMKDGRHLVESAWTYVPSPSKTAKVRLFCIPHAGGTTDLFYLWPKLLGDSIETVFVELPGRGRRFQEPSMTNLSHLISGVREAILHYSDLPFALFGHSMGAMLAFELIRSLEAHSVFAQHLFLSACAAPQRIRDGAQNIRDTQALISYLKTLGGTPAEIFDDQDLMKLILPSIRADFGIVQNYEFNSGAPVRSPVSLLMATSDPRTETADISLWRQVLDGPADVRLFSGGHFYLKQHGAQVTQLIRTTLSEHLQSRVQVR